jgi:hypothetical protein
MKSLLLAALAVLTLTTACKKDEDTSPPTPSPMQVTGTFSGANETPAVTTSATGNVSATYDKSTKTLTYTVTYAGLTPTAGHFHLGAPGVAGPVVITFPYVAYSPIMGSTLLTPSQETALLAGNMYANLHTTANPSGEIRANVVAK